MSDHDSKIGTAVYKRCYIVLKPLHTRPLEAEMQRHLQHVELHVRVGKAVGSPYFALAQIGAGTHHIVQQREIDTKADAREHKLAHYSGLHTHRLFYRKEVLLKVEVIDSDTHYRSITELRKRALGQSDKCYKDKQQSCATGLHNTVNHYFAQR